MESENKKVKAALARAKALSQEERRSIAKNAAQVRWSNERNIPQATHTGTLTIGEMHFPCSVLSDGTRILTQTDFMRGMGMYYSGWVSKNRPVEDIAAEVPQFLSYQNIKPHVDKHLGNLQSIIVKYRTEKGKLANGIKAEIIPKICDVWLDAEEHGNLGSRQKVIAKKARLLMRSLAHVGIIALVDEATGYQYSRARDALAEILEQFISKELAKWAKRFPDEFYQEMFRLKGWKYDSVTTKRPLVAGKLTNNLVYERLAPGVLEELKRITPKNNQGRPKHRYHQRLTDDVGHPKLKEHLSAVVALMKAFDDWDTFYKAIGRSLPKQVALPLLEWKEDTPAANN